jgi:hypothetical protein
MSNPTDWRALCAIAVELWDADCDMESVISQMRTLLSQPGPEGATNEGRELQWPPSVAVGCHEAAVEAEPGSPLQQLLIAAGDLLESRWCRPTIQPVPVAERPRPEDYDDKGRCWWFDRECQTWSYNEGRLEEETHWLPHWALPTPW